MVQETEKNKSEIYAKNCLENYCFTLRNTLDEETLKEKFEGDDKEKIEEAMQEALDWLDKNQLAEKDEFEAKQKELDGVVNPIMMKVYQAAGGGGTPEGGMPQSAPQAASAGGGEPGRSRSEAQVLRQRRMRQLIEHMQVHRGVVTFDLIRDQVMNEAALMIDEGETDADISEFTDQVFVDLHEAQRFDEQP